MLPILLTNDNNLGRIALVSLIGSLSLILMLDLWFRTFYYFEGSYLHYRTGLIKSKIDVNKLREIQSGRSIWSVVSLHKASWTMKPLVLIYNKWDELAISPAEEDLFIHHLKSINPNISIIEKA